MGVIFIFNWTINTRGARRKQASGALLLLLVLVKYYKIPCLILLYTLFTFLQRKPCWVLFSLVLYWLKFSVLSHIQLSLCFFSFRCKFGTISSFMLTCEFKIYVLKSLKLQFRRSVTLIFEMHFIFYYGSLCIVLFV